MWGLSNTQSGRFKNTGGRQDAVNLLGLALIRVGRPCVAGLCYQVPALADVSNRPVRECFFINRVFMGGVKFWLSPSARVGAQSHPANL
ncbi:hypothetical protein EOV40_002765 [Acetobacter oryzoeni]|uniref:Uncharacterized protein n=1 Tax=Acetobacter oryzoeni TaxID=2500548 RepID=A0A5B9GF98_9PROT|nr:hypothetical protein EOV40_002765 [Acetobacter oryzoeni]